MQYNIVRPAVFVDRPNRFVAHVLLDGAPVGKVPLVYGQTIEQTKEEKPNFWKRLFGG